MTNHEQKLLVAERVVGWKWEIKETSTNWWTRTLLPPEKIGQYTPIWDGIIKCDSVNVLYLDYFNPLTELKDALLVKDCMEEVHGFLCEINYYTGAAEPWTVMFKDLHIIVVRVGRTLHEAIVKVVSSDEMIDHLEQA